MFVALDLVLFFVFFEIVLVPMYFLIAGWGHENRRYAAMKFFLFTMAGSAFLFVGILSVAFLHRSAEGFLTFDSQVLTDWASISGALSDGTARVAVRRVRDRVRSEGSVVPVAHVAARRAHRRADRGLGDPGRRAAEDGHVRVPAVRDPDVPAGGRRLRAAVMLVLAVIGITYGAIVATMQPNLKRLVAYSSVAHLGFVVLGFFALTQQSIQGGLFTMVSHGLTTGALFLLVGMLYERRHTYAIADYKGLWKVIPVFGGLFVIAALGVDRPARLLRLHRRVPVAARCVPHQSLVRRRRHHRRDPRRGLHAVGGAADAHRRTRR